MVVFWVKLLHQLLVDRNLLTLGAEFYNSLVVVCESHSTSMTLVLSSSDNYVFTNQLVT